MKKYTSADIQVLSDRDHVRLRLPMYAGNVDITTYETPCFVGNQFLIHKVEFVPAALKCINEIIDNSVDEFTHTKGNNKKLKIKTGNNIGEYTIADNGRGVPIDVHLQTGKHTPETVFGSLRSGRNFGEKDTAGIIGMNGVGSSIVNFCSTKFLIDIKRDHKHYKQEFTDGASQVATPKINDIASDATGTAITFQLDPTIFSNTDIPEIVIHNRAIEIAFNNPGVSVEYNDQHYKFNKGFDDVVRTLSTKYHCFNSDNIKFYVSFDLNNSIDEQIFSWVNGTYLFEGGICNTQFLNAFYDKVIDHLSKEAKKQKCEVTKNDIRQNLTVFGILKLKTPNFDSQSKSRLTGPNLRKEFDELIEASWKSFVRNNKEWLDSVLARAYERHHADQNKKAIKNHQKNLRKSIPGLIDATGADRENCTIYICEGLSAASTLTEVRDPKTMGSYPLGGKINVTWGCTVAQVLQMGKIANILATIGLVPGQKANISDLKYGRVVLAADFDPDGGDITTILVCLFYGFWPELFDQPFFYRLLAPNVIAIKGKERVYFQSMNDFNSVKDKYSNYKIEYIKGLGSLERVDWETITKSDDYLLPIRGDSSMNQILDLLFGDNADMRKEWLTKKEDVIL